MFLAGNIGCYFRRIKQRQKRAKSENYTSVSYCETASTRRSRQYFGPNIAAISRWPQSGNSEPTQHSNVLSTDCQSTSTQQPAECDVTTATLQREHSGVRIPHIEVSVITLDTEYNCRQATPAYNSVAQRPPSYSMAADMPPANRSTEQVPHSNSAIGGMPPSYSALVGVPHSNNAIADMPPSYCVTEEVSHRNAIADIPPSYSSSMADSPPCYRSIDQ